MEGYRPGKGEFFNDNQERTEYIEGKGGSPFNGMVFHRRKQKDGNPLRDDDLSQVKTA